jgi:predicted Zn-ribbon and HTH transcriptional regulator
MPKTKSTKGCGFSCMECGHRFRTVKAAEKASFGPDGCPICGSSDIDEALPAQYPSNSIDQVLGRQ